MRWFFISLGWVLLLSQSLLLAQSPSKSWKEIKSEGLVSQRYDYSCGPASLATILNYFYGESITELEVLQIINTGEASTFADLANAAEYLGYKSMGIAANLEHLQNLKVPAIAHLQYYGMDHFTVIRGVGKKTVWLADPAWGSRKMAFHQFLEMWKTRDDPELYGRLLIVLPGENNAQPQNAYFRAPEEIDAYQFYRRPRMDIAPSYGHYTLQYQ